VKKYRVILPSWSPLSLEMQAETGCQYPAFINLGGKPLYEHIVRRYDAIRDNSEFVVVLPEGAPSLQLNRLTGFDLRVDYLVASRSIGDSVMAALGGLSIGQSVVVHMADTLLQTHDFDVANDVIYVHSRTDLHRWTTVRKGDGGAICVVADRAHRSTDSEQMVFVGVLVLSDGIFFRRKLEDQLLAPVASMDPFFGAIEAYSVNQTINLKIAEYWNDYGHIDSYYESRLNYHNLRHFNSLTYDADRGLVTKRSEDSEAFRHQVRWFSQIPDGLSSFLPRIYASSDGAEPYITMELLSIPTASDLLVNCRLQLGAWNEVARKIKRVQFILGRYSTKSPLAQQVATEVYIGKTTRRILQYLDQHPYASDLWVSVSGQRFGLDHVLETLHDYATQNRLLTLSALAPIHGDLCFSNIMYDSRSRQIKLIDPRGEFGVPGIYGDPRYDKAKLMHSYAGGYDLIVSDRFDHMVSANGFLECSIHKVDYHNKVGEIFENEIFIDEEDRLQCRAIQALLFLSMLPLHCDSPNRQHAMLHVGLVLYANCMGKSAK